MEKISLIKFLKSQGSIKLADSIYEQFVISVHVIKESFIEIDDEERIVSISYRLPLEIESVLWGITEVFNKKSDSEDDRWYWNVNPYKIIFKLLSDILNIVYARIARKKKWGLFVREKSKMPINKDDSRTFFVQFRENKQKDSQRDFISLIRKHDPEIFKKAIRSNMLSDINEISDNKLKDRNRKNLKTQVEKLTTQREHKLQNPQYIEKYMDRLKKTGLIDSQYRLLVKQKRFISLFRKLIKKIISNEQPNYHQCPVCKKDYEPLTKQKRKYCYLDKCRQKEYRVRQGG